MAEEATKQQKPADKNNWADLENDEDDDQEIGIQGASTTATEAKGTEEEKKEGASGEGKGEGAEGKAQGYSKRPRKDYGDKYDPNYKKKIWSKGAQFNKDKNMAPAIVRTKNERGEYIVSSFNIPDRADKIKAADKVSVF